MGKDLFGILLLCKSTMSSLFPPGAATPLLSFFLSALLILCCFYSYFYSFFEICKRELTTQNHLFTSTTMDGNEGKIFEILLRLLLGKSNCASLLFSPVPPHRCVFSIYLSFVKLLKHVKLTAQDKCFLCAWLAFRSLSKLMVLVFSPVACGRGGRGRPERALWKLHTPPRESIIFDAKPHMNEHVEIKEFSKKKRSCLQCLSSYIQISV
ncbi:hypothetical protein BDW02DRAFT_19937 [Decorospora gaudefroyi]|uniref:Uncharacterized protein n=1 Tax=Decorospora gaudefroyi TaxID=184978 RepID=A0A6A5KAN5_9PLEO|nr:hypothetical protein BDW02DRAFT_19937 [Decorospora gaudefroyi]